MATSCDIDPKLDATGIFLASIKATLPFVVLRGMTTEAATSSSEPPLLLDERAAEGKETKPLLSIAFFVFRHDTDGVGGPVGRSFAVASEGWVCTERNTER